MGALESIKAAIQAIGADIKVLKNGKQDKLAFDVAPTNGSNNPVTSDGVSKAVAGAVGVVNHGTNASTPRPQGYGSVYWIGSATPTNAVDGDIWRNG